jgi:hypothetical protein
MTNYRLIFPVKGVKNYSVPRVLTKKGKHVLTGNCSSAYYGTARRTEGEYLRSRIAYFCTFPDL